MPTTSLQLEIAVAAREDAQVTAWRFEQLRGAGYDEPTARYLSVRDEVDLHRAIELVESGCPLELAVRILE